MTTSAQKQKTVSAPAKAAKPAKVPKAKPVAQSVAAAIPQPQPNVYKFEFDVTAVQIIVAGLDELPGKVGRQLREGILQMAMAQDAARNQADKDKPAAKDAGGKAS